ncbi:MAG: hypothetical protein LBU50_03875, partial [Cellulomonas sp.]|nr:hypothetical protein [Cellulomonas sp.]
MISPAQHMVSFNDGNPRAARDPHDPRSLRATRRDDLIVISDDPTLGQTVSLGFGEISAVTAGGAG